jgi:hypothetical protein
MSPRTAPLSFRASHRQGGLSLIFALLALVALSLGAIALVRSVDTGTLVLGNLGFKQETTASTEEATEAAIAYLEGATSLDADVVSSGYYASSHDTVDPTGEQGTSSTRELIDWDGNDCNGLTTAGSCTLSAKTGPSNAGTSTQYVIFRLCSTTGASSSSNVCLKPSEETGTSTKRGKLDYSDYARFGTLTGPYYRIIVRAKGARDTTSFTETIVHF